MTTEHDDPVAEARRVLYWKVQGARSHMQMQRETDDAFAKYEDFIVAHEQAKYEALVEALMERLGSLHSEDHFLNEWSYPAASCAICTALAALEGAH